MLFLSLLHQKGSLHNCSAKLHLFLPSTNEMANLDAATQIRLGYICIMSPKAARESTARVAVAHVFPENNSANMLF
jgi:hypothetical protein